jgi:hypothetical protein
MIIFERCIIQYIPLGICRAPLILHVGETIEGGQWRMNRGLKSEILSFKKVRACWYPNIKPYKIIVFCILKIIHKAKLVVNSVRKDRCLCWRAEKGVL